MHPWFLFMLFYFIYLCWVGPRKCKHTNHQTSRPEKETWNSQSWQGINWHFCKWSKSLGFHFSTLYCLNNYFSVSTCRLSGPFLLFNMFYLIISLNHCPFSFIPKHSVYLHFLFTNWLPIDHLNIWCIWANITFKLVVQLVHISFYSHVLQLDESKTGVQRFRYKI